MVGEAPMKLIIAGSRTLNVSPEFIISKVIEFNINPSLIISGRAKGIDTSGEQFAQLEGIPIQIHAADWNTHGKSAGYIRNAEMAKAGDALLLIWDGKSKGSQMMKALMKKAGKPIYEVVL